MKNLLIWFFRFVFIVLIQVLILKRLGSEEYNFISCFIYPLFLMWLPYNVPRYMQLLIGFFMGLTIDAFYNTYGMHASTGTFIMFARNFILARITPASGYLNNLAMTRNNYGFIWFFSYLALFLFTHLLWYFSVEQFSFVFIKDIMMRTLSSFIVSFVLISIYQAIFNPKQ